MLRDKIKTILATETSDMYKINKLAIALEKLFVDELNDATVAALKRIYDDRTTDTPKVTE